METQEIECKPYGIGLWVRATVSKEVAQALAYEYSSYGWEVKLDGFLVAPKSLKQAT
ncbi:hypothetical protein [Vibrio pelagius]|uniref:hypothetical protein n=1 Tax=Vibrio pelagius TaxID=28169 RepID=UPI0035543213